MKSLCRKWMTRLGICFSVCGLVGLLVVLFMGGATGCGYIRFGERDDPAFGSLKLSVTEPMSPLVFLPGGDNTVSYYTVTLSPLSLPDPPRVETPVPYPPPPEGVLFENLIEDPSGYQIDIQGFTVGDELITQATDVVMIIAQELSETTIQMEILTDPTAGVFIDIHIDPVDFVPYALVVGQWFQDDVWGPAPWEEITDGMWEMAMEDLTPGYALSVWELFSDGYETFKICGAAEAVYLRAFRETAGTYLLNESNIGEAITTGAAIVIIWEAPSPILTMFTDGLTEVNVGEEFTLTTVTDTDPIDSHNWYKDGVLMPGEESADLTQTAPLEPGMANYSKVGFKGDIITSGSKLIVFSHPFDDVTWVTPSPDVDATNPMTSLPFEGVCLDTEGNPYNREVFFRLSPACTADILAHVSLDAASAIPVDGVWSVNAVNDGFDPYLSGNALAIEVHQNPGFDGLFEESWFYRF